MDEIFFNDIIDKFPNEKLINFTNQINFQYTNIKLQMILCIYITKITIAFQNFIKMLSVVIDLSIK